MAGAKSNPNIYMYEIVKDLIIVKNKYLQVCAPTDLLPPTWPHFFTTSQCESITRLIYLLAQSPLDLLISRNGVTDITAVTLS